MGPVARSGLHICFVSPAPCFRMGAFHTPMFTSGFSADREVCNSVLFTMQPLKSCEGGSLPLWEEQPPGVSAQMELRPSGFTQLALNSRVLCVGICRPLVYLVCAFSDVHLQDTMRHTASPLIPTTVPAKYTFSFLFTEEGA